MSHLNPNPCRHCGKPWGVHRATDNACPTVFEPTPWCGRAVTPDKAPDNAVGWAITNIPQPTADRLAARQPTPDNAHASEWAALQASEWAALKVTLQASLQAALQALTHATSPPPPPHPEEYDPLTPDNLTEDDRALLGALLRNYVFERVNLGVIVFPTRGAARVLTLEDISEYVEYRFASMPQEYLERTTRRTLAQVNRAVALVAGLGPSFWSTT